MVLLLIKITCSGTFLCSYHQELNIKMNIIYIQIHLKYVANEQKIHVYSKYFVLLEKGMTYYRDYQNIKEISILKENHKIQINKQNNKLDKLQDQIKTLLIHSKKQMKKSDEILKVNIDIKKDSKKTKKQLNTITEVLVDTREELLESHKKIDKYHRSISRY